MYKAARNPPKMSQKVNYLLFLCRKSRFFLLLPTIICWCFALTSTKSTAGTYYSKNSTYYSFANNAINDEYSLITVLANITAVIVVLVDVNRLLRIWTTLVIVALGATVGFTSAATVTLASHKPAPTILSSPVVMSPLSQKMDSQITSTPISPQKKQSQAPLLQVSNDIEFVPLTREFIEILDDKDRYNRYATPNQYDGIATNVSMSMYIEGISSFSAQTMDYHLDMYFYQEWHDLRLRHNGTGPMLIRDKSVFKKIWHPDIYFANARYASFQEITEDNFLMWVYPSGRIWYDCRISLVAICMMDLWKYPLDSQICELRILSYAYPESQLRLRWSHTINPPIDRNLEIRMPDMKLVDIKTGDCNGTYATGKWSCMTAVFYVQREMMHHIIQTYVPTALIVVISWFNFWLDIDSAPARVSLSITTLLTIATQANAVKLALPEVSYMKAIDVWMGMCMAFVFSVMVEYTIAHFAKNREQRQRMRQAMHNSNFMMDSTLSTLFDTQHLNGGFRGGAPQASFMSAPMFSHPNSAKSSTSCDAGATLNSTRRTSISARVRESLKRKRQSIGSTVMAPFRSATGEQNYVGSGTGSFRPDVAEPLHTVLQYPPLANEYDDADEFFEDVEFGYAEDGALFTENFSPQSYSHNNGALRNSPKKNMKKNISNKSANDNKHCDHANYIGSNTPEARLRIPRQLRSSVTPEDIRSSSAEPVSVSATIGTAKSAPVCFSLTDEDESEIVVVRQKKNYRDSVSRFGKQMGRRAQEMRKSWSRLTGHEVATKIDQRSRIVFPSAFILFNIIYWSYYLVFN